MVSMKPAVEILLRELYGTGALHAGELDERVLQALASLTEGDGIAALAEFMRADMSKIRNKSAYLSGVVSRIKGESVGKTGASSQFSAAPGNGLSYASAAAPMGVHVVDNVVGMGAVSAASAASAMPGSFVVLAAPVSLFFTLAL
jgi:hypothetical protein